MEKFAPSLGVRIRTEPSIKPTSWNFFAKKSYCTVRRKPLLLIREWRIVVDILATVSDSHDSKTVDDYTAVLCWSRR